MRVITMLAILVAYSAACYLLIISTLTVLFALSSELPAWALAAIAASALFLIARGVLRLLSVRYDDT